VARVLAATGRDQCDWTAEYRLFSRSRWQTRDLFFSVIQRALPFAGPEKEPIVLAGDFTHLVKSGRHIPLLHCMRDPLSPPFHANLIYGLRFFSGDGPLSVSRPARAAFAGSFCARAF
jgi:hypothetical protein